MQELNIDWAALHSAFQMNMPEVRCFLSLEEGKVLKLPPGDPTLATVRADPQRYIAIDAIPSRIQYQWLDDFIRSIENEDTRGRMEAAINGKGAFRRFKDILLTLPEERRRWFEYRDQMMRQRIVEWVREQSVSPSNEAPWLEGEPYDPQQPTITPVAASLDTDADMDVDEDEIGNVAMGGSRSASVTMRTMPISVPRQHAPPTLHLAPPVLGQFTRQSPTASNSPHEVEALRDLIIEWFDRREQASVPTPLELETLAHEVSKGFQLKSVHG